MINWKVRAKNPLFWVEIVMAVLTPILAYFGLTGADITSWPYLFETLKNAVLNPYVCALVAVSVWNAVTDPTTAGASDSKLALTYTQPRKED